MSSVSSAIQKAAELDALGDHDEAVNELARGTQAGDLSAMTALGKRLIVGDRAPYLPKDGAGMVLEAANKGCVEAIAQVAVFQCTGIYQEKSWAKALETLTWSAKLGWLPARRQLLLLSGEKFENLESLSANKDEKHWLALGESLDLAPWFTVPEGEVLNEAPLIRSFSDFIPKDVCKFLVDQSQHRLQPALVYDAVNKRNIRFKTRTNSIAQFNLVENELLHFLLQERMSAACAVPMIQMEATAILNYQPGEQISEHYDFVDPELPNYQQEIAENGQRIITFLIYLNDEYTGGETSFPKVGVEHRGKMGEGMYFVNSLADGSADLQSQHAGRPPLTGEKWIVSQFIRNRPVQYIL